MINVDKVRDKMAFRFCGIQTVVTYVHDVQASAVFYTRVLGLPCVYEEDGVMALDAGGSRILLHRGVPGEAGAQQGQEVYWQVEDLDGLIETVRAAGSEVVQEPTDEPWGERDATFLDPDGNRINVTEPGEDTWMR